MELTVISLVATVAIVSLVGIALVLGSCAGLLYGRYYYDGAECSGSRHWPRFAALCAYLLAPLRYYLSYEIVYHDAEAVQRFAKAHVIFAGHPHGLLAIGSLLLLTSPASKKRHGWPWLDVRACIHRHVFSVPLLRDCALWLGAVDVSAENMVCALRTHSIYLAPGGCREMILSDLTPIQRRHTGFLRIAFENLHIVFPVVHLGQEAVFRSYTCAWLDRVRHWVLDLTGYPFPTFFFGPFPARLTTHVLPPLDPRLYDSKEAFIDAYYMFVTRFYADQ